MCPTLAHYLLTEFCLNWGCLSSLSLPHGNRICRGCTDACCALNLQGGTLQMPFPQCRCPGRALFHSEHCWIFSASDGTAAIKQHTVTATTATTRQNARIAPINDNDCQCPWKSTQGLMSWNWQDCATHCWGPERIWTKVKRGHQLTKLLLLSEQIVWELSVQ